MKYLMLLLLSCLLFACGPKKLAVKNADTLIVHQITKRVPLYSAQKDELAKDVDRFLVNKKPMVQEIVPIIDELDFKDSGRLESQYQTLETHYRKIAQDFSALMAKYLSKLDAKQQKEFISNLEDENKKIAVKVKRNPMSDIESRFKLFFDSISDSQKKLLNTYKDYFKARNELRLQNRLKLQEQIRGLTSEELSAESKQKMIQDYFTEYQKASLEDNKNVEILKKIAPTLSDEQRKYFKEEAQDIKETLKYFISVDY